AAAAADAHSSAAQKRRQEAAAAARKAAQAAHDAQAKGTSPVDVSANDELEGGEEGSVDDPRDAEQYAESFERVSVVSGLGAGGLAVTGGLLLLAGPEMVPVAAALEIYAGYLSAASVVADLGAVISSGIAGHWHGDEFAKTCGSAALGLVTFGNGKAISQAAEGVASGVGMVADGVQEVAGSITRGLSSWWD
ncbi:hypothetical protein, partial [Streptomyces sp. SID8499]|uniref:hypothetical protein n=1 Tax=Streptomyces sp. SID8499 TaxID=2706106 RepID=UPI0013CC85D9